MITWQDVVNMVPQLATEPVATQNAILLVVQKQVDDVAWGEFADQGRVYLAAHLASIRSNHGLVTSESLGPMSRAYALPPGILGSLALSTYGAEYERLLRIAMGITAFVP